MAINDNTTTALTIDFDDTILLSGISMDYQFAQVNSATGKILGLTPGTFSHDGATINAFYITAFLTRTPLIGRNFVGYATGNVQGNGALQITALLPGNVGQPIGTWPLASPATRGHGALHQHSGGTSRIPVEHRR